MYKKFWCSFLLTLALAATLGALSVYAQESETEDESSSICFHINVEMRVIKEANTCLDDGEYEKYCSDCGNHLGSESFIGPHHYGDWVIVEEATVQQEGREKSVCTGCGDERSRTIQRLPEPEPPKAEPPKPEQAPESSGGWSSPVKATAGWKETRRGNRYYANGWRYLTGWQDIEGSRYYFDKNGYCQIGWYQEAESGDWYHFGEDGKMSVGWVTVEGSRYYLGETGKRQSDWVQDEGVWYYLDLSGKMKTGWVQDSDNDWYYLDDMGQMQTGWLWKDGCWYYLSGSGKMRTGWQLTDGVWYYLKPSGAMATGWTQTEDGLLFFSADGKMAVQSA